MIIKKIVIILKKQNEKFHNFLGFTIFQIFYISYFFVLFSYISKNYCHVN